MKPLLILPVENQVRELDAKLLVAVLAAQEGFTSVLGWKASIDRQISRFPPSVYFAKSFSQQNTKMLEIKRKLGHYVIAWDEEAVVHYPPEIYYKRRIGERSIELIDQIVAWGEDNRELLLGHPACQESKIQVLGNPRADLLRPEMRELFADRVRELKSTYGDFVLVNTNFGSVNGYHDIQNLLYREKEGGELIRGRGSLGMPEDYVRGLYDYRTKVMGAFLELLPRLASALPNRQFVLRPHPAENHELWREHLKAHRNVTVLSEGNVVPWLMACEVLIQNGCTTAVEGFLLGTRVLSFVPIPDSPYEFRLPNEVGVRCRDLSELMRGVEDPVFDRDPGGERARLVARFIHATSDRLASQRIVDLLPRKSPHATLLRWPVRVLGMVKGEIRARKKASSEKKGALRYSEGFKKQRFPELEPSRLQDLADRLVRITRSRQRVRVTSRSEDIVEVRGLLASDGVSAAVEG